MYETHIVEPQCTARSPRGEAIFDCLKSPHKPEFACLELVSFLLEINKVCSYWGEGWEPQRENSSVKADSANKPGTLSDSTPPLFGISSRLLFDHHLSFTSRLPFAQEASQDLQLVDGCHMYDHAMISMPRLQGLLKSSHVLNQAQAWQDLVWSSSFC